MWFINGAFIFILIMAILVMVDVFRTNAMTRKVNHAVDDLRDQYQRELNKDS